MENYYQRLPIHFGGRRKTARCMSKLNLNSKRAQRSLCRESAGHYDLLCVMYLPIFPGTPMVAPCQQRPSRDPAAMYLARPICLASSKRICKHRTVVLDIRLQSSLRDYATMQSRFETFYIIDGPAAHRSDEGQNLVRRILWWLRIDLSYTHLMLAAINTRHKP